MRKIKFRVWDNLLKEMIAHEQLLEDQRCGPLTYAELITIEENDGALMQSTGLADRNGREIYEGDVLAERGNLNRLGLVRYEPNIASFMVFVDGGYCHLNEGNWGNGPQLKYTEVIGNIYENPDLLEVGK